MIYKNPMSSPVLKFFLNQPYSHQTETNISREKKRAPVYSRARLLTSREGYFFSFFSSSSCFSSFSARFTRSLSRQDWWVARCHTALSSLERALTRASETSLGTSLPSDISFASRLARARGVRAIPLPSSLSVCFLAPG